MAAQVVVGIEVAHAPLDIALRPTGDRWAVAHDDVGIAALVERLQAVPPPVLVRAATGGDQRAVGAALAAAGLSVAVVQPRQARDCATATGPLAKPEALDARALAPVAEAVRPTRTAVGMHPPAPDGHPGASHLAHHLAGGTGR